MTIKSSLTKSGITLSSELTFDFQNLQKEVQEQLISAMHQVGSEAIKVWKVNATSKLKSPQSYVTALSVNESNVPDIQMDSIYYKIVQAQRTKDGSQSVAMLMENGIGPFDMKEKLLKGRDKVIIRFEYGSPEQHHSKPLHGDIHKFISDSPKMKFTQKDYNKHFGDDYAGELSPRKSKFFSATVRGANTISGSNEFNNPIAQRIMDFTGGKGRTVNYKWKSPMLHNLYKDEYQSGSENAVHTYSVYRSVTRNSDDDSWVHPGVIAKRILQDSIPEIIPFFKATVQTALYLGIQKAGG